MLSPSAVPLLLRLAAAAVTGTAALLALRRFHRDEAVAAIRRDIRDALLLLDDGNRPPVVLVAGFRAHGKSSFINTACRALAAESGPLLLRAETAPPGPGGATLERRIVRAAVAGGGCEEEEDDDDAAAVEMVDAPALPEPGRLTRADVEAALAGGAGAPPPECVALVLRCGGPRKERHLAAKKLAEIATAIRERGLQFVVVLTQRKKIRSRRKAEELRREIAFRARTDSVYLIENYTAGDALNLESPWAARNNFGTHFTALTIVRQCIEFTKLRRRMRKERENGRS
ncbi:hypothetical protein Cni_G12571 [Canna indica]|uniref:Uncharacterized protein n=1 Tax=Canna indica TaxID=4628 RepID=A0AAQ3KDR6_9LILI|nr:hypothetical protein Cni_G12571 [Canna indica]